MNFLKEKLLHRGILENFIKNEFLWPLAFINFVQQKRHNSIPVLHFLVSIEFLVSFQNKKY